MRNKNAVLINVGAILETILHILQHDFFNSATVLFTGRHFSVPDLDARFQPKQISAKSTQG